MTKLGHTTLVSDIKKTRLLLKDMEKEKFPFFPTFSHYLEHFADGLSLEWTLECIQDFTVGSTPFCIFSSKRSKSRFAKGQFFYDVYRYCVKIGNFLREAAKKPKGL